MILVYFTGADPNQLISRSGVVKLIELLFLILAMATFFSGSVSYYSGVKNSVYFVSSMMVSSFLHTIFILASFVFGGLVFQTSLFNLMVSGFYVLMLLVSAIVTFVMAADGTVIAAGVFLLFATLTFAADCYLAYDNLRSSVRTTTTPGSAAGVHPQHQQPSPLPSAPRSQPYTAPPAYSPPPGLEGNGLYTIPLRGEGKGVGGGMGQVNSTYDNNENLYSEVGENRTQVYYNEGGRENII